MLAENGIRLEYSDKAREWIASAGYDPLYGARPVKRTIPVSYTHLDVYKRQLQVQGFPEFRHQRVFLRDVLHPVLESDRARGPYLFIDRDLQLDPSRHSGQLGDPHEHSGLAAQDFVAQLRRRDAHRDRVAAEEHLLEGRDEARPPFADQRQDRCV